MFSPADLAFVRSHFPALDTPWALLDNAGGSVPLRGAIERVADYMSRCCVQHGGTYAQSAEAMRLFHEGHAAAARLVGADENEMFLGPSSTACLRLLARALRPMFRPGDEVVVTDLDHESNIGPWRELAEDGVVVREWAMDRGLAELTPAGLDAVLSPRTRLVAFTHVSNIVGTVHDAAALVKRIHAAGALACVDGVAFAPHRRVDVRAIGADFYAVSLYKLFGPHLGMVYGKRDLLQRARSQNHAFIPADAVPYKFEPGSVPHELVAALPAIGAYFAELEARFGDAFAAVERHEAALAAPLLDFLRSRRGVRVLGRPGADRVPTVAFAVEGRDAFSVLPALDAALVAVKAGDFYAARAVDALGLRGRNGVVRASFLHYNTPDETRRLIAALDSTL
ncbi:MAG: aminotransferase class V-fold PLP-dependent enzyme [Planctomycetia bacterium]|nr:aminotransferase class V-fold PLP-dependent enzyme [Planctomycetia bacterium]